MTKHVLLLRGINVGGHKKVPMIELKKMMVDLGFENVKTLLNSGNVVFETKKEKESVLLQKIGEALENTFGFKVNLMLRTDKEIQKIIHLAPFKNTVVDKDIRLYISFLSEATNSKLVLPYSSAENDFQIVQKTEREVFSMVNVKTFRTVDAMKFLKKEFGKDLTTRNWNTVLKIGALIN